MASSGGIGGGGEGGGSGGGTWSRVKDVLRDTAVDAAMDEARTSYLYQKLYEEERKKWEVKEVKRGIRVDIKDEVDKHRSKRDEEENAERNKEEIDKELEEFEKELEQDPELRKLQEERREELKNQFKQTQLNLSKGFGEYLQMDEKDMLKLASDISFVIVHFFSTDFQNCQILDHHLSILASKHIDVRFIKCDAKKSPFLTNKWKIKTLPTLCIVVHGFLVDKIIGFTDLGNTSNFPTIALERRLATSGVIKTKEGKRQEKQPRTQIIT